MLPAVEVVVKASFVKYFDSKDFDIEPSEQPTVMQAD